MTKKLYKNAFGKMKPDEHFEQRLAQKLTEHGRSHVFGLHRKVIIPVAAGFVVVACVWLFAISDLKDERSPFVSEPTAQTSVTGSVVIPKIELPKKSNAMMDMVGLIVYQGRIYTQTSTHILPEFAKSLMGEKIGRTKGNIDEWSSQKEYAQELASSIGEQDVYTVKGYDSDFRIMTYQIADGQIWSEFYECLNGITISSGADLFNMLKMMGNVQSASWVDFESWNNSTKKYQRLPSDAPLQEFLQSLNAATPIEWEKLYNEGIYKNGGQNQKFMFLKLKDQTEVRLDLHKGGYVRYTPANVFFKLDVDVFESLWGSLK